MRVARSIGADHTTSTRSSAARRRPGVRPDRQRLQRLKELLGQRWRQAAGRALGATSSLAERFTTD
jgi:hypothetical protein